MFIKTCTVCNKTHKFPSIKSIPNVDFQYGEDFSLVLFNCDCNSTLAIELTPIPEVIHYGLSNKDTVCYQRLNEVNVSDDVSDVNCNKCLNGIHELLRRG